MPRKRTPKTAPPTPLLVEVLEETDPTEMPSLADTLMLTANEAILSARVDEWLFTVRVVEKLLRDIPSGKKRDGVEWWLLRQWKRPEWTE